MYTRCPHCSTIFRVTASQLRAALGEVSCGSCQSTFNALNALTDDLPELTSVVVLDTVESEPSEVPDPAEPESPAPDAESDAVAIDDSLVATFVDETVETEISGDLTADAESEADDEEGIVLPAFDDPDTFAEADIGSVEIDEDDEAPATNTTREEPRYDDNTGYEEIIIAATSIDDDAEDGFVAPVEMSVEDDEPTDTESEATGEVGAAVAWSRILADVDDDGLADDRRALEAEARSAIEDDLTGEVAYDDDTGGEEPLSDAYAPSVVDDSSDNTGADDEAALEFNAPEQTWSDIFVQQKSRVLSAITPGRDPEPPEESIESEAEPAEEPAEEEDEALDLSPLSPLESETADPEEWAGFLSELNPNSHPVDEADAATGTIGSEDEERDVDLVPDETVEYPEATGHEVPWLDQVEKVSPSDPLIDYVPEFEPPWEAATAENNEQSPTGRPSVRTIAIAVVLVLALAMQLIHMNRDTLAASPSWGERIRAVYDTFGQPLYPDWSLDSYRVSASEAVAGRTAPAALDIMANVVVIGDSTVGMPMIRVALHDRWSNAVASRVFAPSEYLRDYDTWPILISPGTTLPVEISVADPGTDAQGYVVDICLPRRAAGLQCQLEKDPFQQ